MNAENWTEKPGKPFAAFTGKTVESIKASYTGEKNADTESLLALVDFRKNLIDTLQKTGNQNALKQVQHEGSEELEPAQILSDVKYLLGIAKKGRPAEKRALHAPSMTEAVLNSALNNPEIRKNIADLLVNDNYKRPVELLRMLENKHNIFGIRTALNLRFRNRADAIAFVKENRPDTTDEELRIMYSNRAFKD